MRRISSIKLKVIKGQWFSVTLSMDLLPDLLDIRITAKYQVSKTGDPIQGASDNLTLTSASDLFKSELKKLLDNGYTSIDSPSSNILPDLSNLPEFLDINYLEISVIPPIKKYSTEDELTSEISPDHRTLILPTIEYDPPKTTGRPSNLCEISFYPKEAPISPLMGTLSDWANSALKNYPDLMGISIIGLVSSDLDYLEIIDVVSKSGIDKGRDYLTRVSKEIALVKEVFDDKSLVCPISVRVLEAFDIGDKWEVLSGIFPAGFVLDLESSVGIHGWFESNDDIPF